MAFRSWIGVVCNCGCGNTLAGSTLLAWPPSCDWKYLKTPTSSNIASTVMMTSATPNLPTAMTLTSVSSKPAGRLLFSSMFQDLLQVRLIGRQQRALLQLVKEVSQPDADEAHGRGEIHPAQAEGFFSEIGSDQPVQVDQAHAEDEDGDGSEQFKIAFQVAREKQAEGQREMADDQRQRHVLPAVVEARDVPGNFFGQVAGPDDEELGEGKIGPHHHQRQQEFSQRSEEHTSELQSLRHLV